LLCSNIEETEVKEVKKMRENPGRAHAVVPFHASFDWDATREKMNEACAKEKLAKAIVMGTTLLICGALFYSLIHAFQNYTIIGY
jgi:hypothetical protein